MAKTGMERLEELKKDIYNEDVGESAKDSPHPPCIFIFSSHLPVLCEKGYDRFWSLLPGWEKDRER